MKKNKEPEATGKKVKAKRVRARRKPAPPVLDPVDQPKKAAPAPGNIRLKRPRDGSVPGSSVRAVIPSDGVPRPKTSA